MRAGIRARVGALLRRVADRLDGTGRLPGEAVPYQTEGWDHIPQGQYDYVPKGTYVFGPSNRFLLVQKNRYRAVLLPEQGRRTDLGVGWVTEDNTPEGYDLLWGDPDHLEKFRAEGGHARETLKHEVLDHAGDRLPETGRAVDIGCGVGDLLTELRRRRPGLAVAGLDFSGKAVEGARRALPDGEFIRHEIDDRLPYDTEAFDLVLCTDVLEHLLYPARIAAELLRICRPGGLVVIVVPDGEMDQFMGHNWFWNLQSFAEMLAPLGAEVAKLPQTGELIACIGKSEKVG